MVPTPRHFIKRAFLSFNRRGFSELFINRGVNYVFVCYPLPSRVHPSSVERDPPREDSPLLQGILIGSIVLSAAVVSPDGRGETIDANHRLLTSNDLLMFLFMFDHPFCSKSET
ncbi:hypothetical protein TNCT_519761 [Trichonephila clavata]|uniref:Uncharacterized protein n=1 Tax=Trichonephila clavata TaxID=2740835 RepID=A0A8X6K5R8_TRICU|nr:hypothetical protein TNCT_519761 [Trichonephila clavata]